ncbi:MAG: response regulator transcription factor [Bacteroidia bacterium]
MEYTPTKILLVDDHELILTGLQALLNQEPNLQVVALANNGVAALNLLKTHAVDIVITDVKMPEMNGIVLTQNIKQQYPAIKVLVLTLYNDREYVTEILNADADGYLLKNVGQQELIKAINHIVNNGTYYSQEIVSILKTEMKEKQTQHTTLQELSKRELEIINLICQEYSSNEIAEKLFISKATVDVHRKNILQKTGVKNLVGLIRFALQNGIVQGF